MSKGSRSRVLSTRTTQPERMLVEALAQQEGVSVAKLIHQLLLPVVRQRIAGADDRDPATH
jgi:hypothetical protein